MRGRDGCAAFNGASSAAVRFEVGPYVKIGATSNGFSLSDLKVVEVE
jgi:hypothetical protein